MSVALEALRFDDNEPKSRMGRTVANLEAVMADLGRVRLELGRARRRASSEDGSDLRPGTDANGTGRDETSGAGGTVTRGTGGGTMRCTPTTTP